MSSSGECGSMRLFTLGLAILGACGPAGEEAEVDASGGSQVALAAKPLTLADYPIRAGADQRSLVTASGAYDVYLYVWEDNATKTFDVRVEGSLVQDDYVSGAPGQWKRLGPWTVSVTDGTLNLTTSGGTANLSGLEVYRH